MTSMASVDSVLAQWGDRVFNGSPVKRTKTRRGISGLKLVGGAGTGRGGMDAKAVRGRLGAIVKRTPQAMVRITGGGKSIRHIKAHLDYISRKGRIELEDHNGDRILGKDDVDGLRDEWQFGGFPIGEDGTRREAFNIVLSMPAGTSELGVQRAAREFAATEFQGFQYVMALHTFDTDPDPEPSPNPHVHLCLKATGLDGTRLNPRKADLQRWRDGFAQRLRDNGIEAESTRRLHRLQPVRGEKQSVRHKRGRDETFERIGAAPANAQRVARAACAEKDVMIGYKELANALATSEAPGDRVLAIGLMRRLADDREALERTRDVLRER